MQVGLLYIGLAPCPFASLHLEVAAIDTLEISTCRLIRRCGASGTGRSGGACARATGRKGRSSTRTRCRTCAAPSTRASRLTAPPRAPAIPSSSARVQSPQSDSLRTLRVRRRSLSALLAAARGAQLRAEGQGSGLRSGPSGERVGGCGWGGARQKGDRVCGICGCRGRLWVDDNIQLCVCPWSRSVGSVGIEGPGDGRMIDDSRVYEEQGTRHASHLYSTLCILRFFFAKVVYFFYSCVKPRTPRTPHTCSHTHRVSRRVPGQGPG